MSKSDQRESLAELEHTQWAHWTRHMLDNLTTENIDRWRRQIETPYSDLSEAEKDSDREWADRVIAQLGEFRTIDEEEDEEGRSMSKPADSLSDRLWNQDVSPATFSSKDQYQDQILEMYKVYVKGTVKVTEWRNLANTFFLTLHTLLASAAGFWYAQGPQLPSKFIVLFPLATALLLCYAWFRLVKSYKQLNDGKFKVVDEFEKQLPCRPYVEAEWRGALGEGKDPKLYRSLTDVEVLIPIAFGALYILGAVAVILF